MSLTASCPPFRADHVGSLLRPAALRQAFRRHHAHEIDDAEFALVQDQCIREAVKMQEDIGFEVVTDGEFRRASYWARFIERIEGFGLRASDSAIQGRSGSAERVHRAARHRQDPADAAVGS